MGEGFAGEELSSLPVQPATITVKGSMKQHLAHLAANHGVDQSRCFACIPIVRVMRRKLEIPFEVARPRIQGQHAACVEVRSQTNRAIVVWRWIACCPEDGVGVRVVGSRLPGGTTAELSRIAGPCGPGGISFLRDAPVAPESLSTSRVISVQKALQPTLAGSHSDQDLTIDGKRCVCDGEALLVIVYRHVPYHRSGLGIQRNQVCVERAHVQSIAQNSKASIGHHCATRRDLWWSARVSPDRLPCARIQSRCIIERPSHEHQPVYYDWFSFVRPCAQLKGPLGSE